VALRLRSKGISLVRPLAGGLDGWRERGYPIVNAEEVEAAARGAAASN
jgi:rhodanese-related sulfurtransferase